MIEIFKRTHIGKFWRWYMREFRRKKDIAGGDNLAKLNFLEHNGYVIYEGSEFDSANPLLTWIHDNISPEKIRKASAARVGAKRKAGILDSFDITDNPAIHGLIQDLLIESTDLEKVAAGYFREGFVVDQVAVWLSPGEKFESTSSQMFHFDRESWRQLKIFIPLEKIDKHTGKFVFLDVPETRKFILKMWCRFKIPSLKKRFPDKIVEGFDLNQNSPDLEAGDIFAIDTTNCLHYGSRPAKKPTLRLMIHLLPKSCDRLKNKKIVQLNELSWSLKK